MRIRQDYFAVYTEYADRFKFEHASVNFRAQQTFYNRSFCFLDRIVGAKNPTHAILSL
jgi:hypothetical protein